MLVIGKFSPSKYYVSGSTARHVLHGAAVMYVALSVTVFVYFEEYSDTDQSLTYPSEKLLEVLDLIIPIILGEVYKF
jgi:hypothetical protein